MSWQQYVDEHLMCDIDGNSLTAAAILGQDGSVWSQSSNFPQFKPEEIAAIMKDFDQPGTLAPTGLFLGGTKYMVIQGEAGAVIRGKKGSGGVTVKKTNQALIIGIYDEPMTPGQCNMVVVKTKQQKALKMEVSAPPGVLRSPSSLSSPPLKSGLLTFSTSRRAHLPRKQQHHLNLRHMDSSHSHRIITPCAANNGYSTLTDSPTASGARIGEVKRETKETNVSVKINLDGTGIADSNTGIPFLDHMLDQLASHGLLDVHVRATGDIHIDDHHTNEDVALAIGTALLQALGDRKGINRFGDFSAPLDEAWIHVSLDLSGRPHLGYDLQIPTQRVGTYDTQLVEHFFQSLVNTSGMTLHIRQLSGRNSHHIIEATFKAFARALRQALECDPRRLGSIPSSKGVLSRS